MTGFGYGNSGEWPERVEHGELPDLNTAPEHQIAQLPGVGKDRARNLIDYRERHGALNLIEDLHNVEGFDDALIDKLRIHVLVGGRRMDDRAA